MWQDKNKEHPVFDNDPPTRFCTDYPIIIVRSSLSALGRQEFGLPFCHLICALAFFLFSFSFSCYVLCRYASWKIVVLGTRLKNGRHWRMPWFRRLALPCPARPVPVPLPALHRNFVATTYATNLCSSQQPQHKLVLGEDNSTQSGSIRWAYFMKFWKFAYFEAASRYTTFRCLLCSRQFVNMINLCHSKMLRCAH